MNFDNFLAVLFSKVTLFILSIATIISSFGISALSAKNGVNCTAEDAILCAFCGCITLDTSCDIYYCVSGSIYDCQKACADAVCQASCDAIYCYSDCATDFTDCLNDAGCTSPLLLCYSESCVDFLDTYCTDENGCITCNCEPEKQKVELSDLTYGEIIGDYSRMLSYAEFIDIAYYYYGREFYYKEYTEYCEEYNLYHN